MLVCHLLVAFNFKGRVYWCIGNRHACTQQRLLWPNKTQTTVLVNVLWNQREMMRNDSIWARNQTPLVSHAGMPVQLERAHQWYLNHSLRTIFTVDISDHVHPKTLQFYLFTWIVYSNKQQSPNLKTGQYI